MLAAGRADPSGEWASAATQHGDFVAIWKYQSFEGFTELIDVVDADAEIRQHLANEAAQMREQFGPDDLRTEAAEGRLFRHNNPTRSK